ncbi:nucleoporin p58/p45-like [Clavelina lepadiformis]|uniref:nucleoporin p58/p45-like n=1 Tax=Clavelina lepadiformis TaxID=159417 RepID=UPI0040412587
MAFGGFGSGSTGSGFSLKGPATTTQSTFSGFGSTSLSASKPLGTGLTLTTSRSATSSAGFSFGLGLASSGNTSTTTTSFSSGMFGAKSSAPAPSAGLGFGLTSSATSSASISQPVNLLSQTQSKPEFKGLGGVDLSSSSTANGNGNKNSTVSQAVKDQAVPDEICKDVQAFEKYVAKQREESNKVGQFSVHSLHKINEEINSVSVALATISSSMQRNKAAVEKLREVFGKQLKHAEMAQQTHNTPSTLQHDNVAPIRYFVDLVTEFGDSMKLYRLQIDELENHLHTLSQSHFLTPQDISSALLKTQETFVILASNLHSVHDNVKHLKEQYLAYRRVVHGDSTDIFHLHDKENQSSSLQKTSIKGPAPFQNLSNVAALAMASMLQPQQQTVQQAPPQQGFMKSSFGLGGGSSGLFGSTSTASGGLFAPKPAASTSNLFGSSTSNNSNIKLGSSNPLKPTLSAGFNKSSSGNVFFGSNQTFNSAAGVTFGGSASRPAMQLKLGEVPVNNKRNKNK